MVDATFVSLKGLLHDAGISLFLARPLATPEQAVEYLKSNLIAAGLDPLVWEDTMESYNKYIREYFRTRVRTPLMAEVREQTLKIVTRMFSRDRRPAPALHIQTIEDFKQFLLKGDYYRLGQCVPSAQVDMLSWPAQGSLLEQVLFKRLNIQSLEALENSDCVPGLAVIELQIEAILRGDTSKSVVDDRNAVCDRIDHIMNKRAAPRGFRYVVPEYPVERKGPDRRPAATRYIQSMADPLSSSRAAIEHLNKTLRKTSRRVVSGEENRPPSQASRTERSDTHRSRTMNASHMDKVPSASLRSLPPGRERDNDSDDDTPLSRLVHARNEAKRGANPSAGEGEAPAKQARRNSRKINSDDEMEQDR